MLGSIVLSLHITVTKIKLLGV